MSNDALRERWKAHWREREEVLEQAKALGLLPGAYSLPPFPDELRDMTCGAKTRAGTPCKQRALYTNGRCKFHGGSATGPTSEAGREQARINGKKGGRPRKLAGLETEAHEVLKDVNVCRVPPGACRLSDVAINRCAYCAKLAPDGVCLAAERGEIPGGPNLRPSVSDPRRCQAFRHWKT